MTNTETRPWEWPVNSAFDSGQTCLRLQFSAKLMRQIDAVAERRSLSREEFARSAVIWALDSIAAEVALTQMGLVE